MGLSFFILWTLLLHSPGGSEGGGNKPDVAFAVSYGRGLLFVGGRRGIDVSHPQGLSFSKFLQWSSWLIDLMEGAVEWRHEGLWELKAVWCFHSLLPLQLSCWVNMMTIKLLLMHLSFFPVIYSKGGWESLVEGTDWAPCGKFVTLSCINTNRTCVNKQNHKLLTCADMIHSRLVNSFYNF